MQILLLLSFLGLALSACPNQCSGHGYCDENERCVCFRAPGTPLSQVAYIGADCSQRVCPYGTSHDMVRVQGCPFAAPFLYICPSLFTL